jgi:hypothetical protein
MCKKEYVLLFEKQQSTGGGYILWKIVVVQINIFIVICALLFWRQYGN